MLGIYDLDPEAITKMVQVDLASLASEPESPIGNFGFNQCTGGVAAFKGRPPWELHSEGDELLLILAGRSELTVLVDGVRTTRTLSAGQLVVVPRGHWHSNDASEGVTMLWVTPSQGNEHSWDEPTV